MNIARKLMAGAEARAEENMSVVRAERDVPREVFEREFDSPVFDRAAYGVLRFHGLAYWVNALIWLVLPGYAVSVGGVLLGHTFWDAQRPSRDRADNVTYPNPPVSLIIQRERNLRAGLRVQTALTWARVVLSLSLYAVVSSVGGQFAESLLCVAYVVFSLGALVDMRALAVVLTNDIREVHAKYYEAGAERFPFASKARDSVIASRPAA